MLEKKLCIGTAQFGLPYGITNTLGKIQIHEIKKILQLIKENDINLIDTAQSYGESERIIGEIIEKNDKFFKIITKISPHFSKKLPKIKQLQEWTNKFETSLNRLNQSYIEGVLIHDPLMNLYQKSVIMEWLTTLRKKGLVKKIGWSIYSECDLLGISLDHIDIVQLPFSFYDRRFMETGLLKKLYMKGIDIYARSIFLQGLILTSYSKWPEWVDPQDSELHKIIHENIFDNGSTPIETAIGFVQSCPYINTMVFGFSSTRELLDIINVFKDRFKLISDHNFSGVSFTKNLLDPRLWPIKN